MKISVFIAVTFLMFSQFSSAQLISCERTAFRQQDIDFARGSMSFTMNEANTPITVRTKPKGVVYLQLMALGNPATNIPDNYNLMRDSSHSDNEWDAWTTTLPVVYPVRNSFHVKGRMLGVNYPVSADVGNPGDMKNINITGLPSNNNLYPTPQVMLSAQLERVGSRATFSDSVVVDDILAGESITVPIGIVSHGSILVSDNQGSSSKMNMPTDNENVTIDIYSGVEGSSDNYLNVSGMTILSSPGNTAFQTMARINTNFNAVGKYSKTITMTAGCP
ncbi:hypothetical protein [Enterobacter asburiae]|uniref:hypothetical protein n=1 Tax=Enterobacter asburiae TaxID=61645 RepID=UPI0018EC24D6|nr:hypothetical protein [Enterobacter asburiae]MBJ6588759.1 hypothetical protein [Enterobacter asburiae]